MPAVLHQAISASAGSGKTFQLAHRYIRLLAGGVRPERIVALTFSRKAAAEIFDSMVAYLCRAAESPADAEQTATRIGCASVGRDDFLQMLRRVLDSLHRLHIGTLDSFIVGVIRAFPAELGVAPDFQIADDADASGAALRQDALAGIFNPRQTDRAAQMRFVEAFEQATFGREEKSLVSRLDAFIRDYRAHYLVLPSADAWGRESVVWPRGCPWLRTGRDAAAVCRDAATHIAELALSPKVAARWKTFFEAVGAYDAGAAWSRDIEYLFEKLIAVAGDVAAGHAAVKIDHVAMTLAGPLAPLVLELLTHVMGTDLRAALQRTRGIYRVLDEYERLYDETVRAKGVLTFSDAQFLLTAANRRSGGRVLSRVPDQTQRLYIDYRLDCELDHWLLDEFQDTSDLQWEVLANLADEILQDESGDRSFFYVGDVKQAIYGWRGGNARLFGRILERYAGRIAEHPLNTSFRSCQPVIDTVNRVFGSLPEEFSEDVKDAWGTVWQEHRCEPRVVPETGSVALLEPPCEDGAVKPSPKDRYRVVAGILNEIRPIDRGLSAAVLVRTNEHGRDIVDFLRAECPGMRVIHEGRASIGDSPVVSSLLSLVKLAVHPGDTFAWRHVQMGPLAASLASRGLDRNALPLALLTPLHAGGFGRLLREWGQAMEERVSLDAFGKKRLADLLLAAAEFDRSGSHEVNAFLRFIEDYQTQEGAADRTIRVMTVHQSKGLGFDVVLLPDLQDGGMIGAGQVDFVTSRDPLTNRPCWALRMPRRAIAEHDEALNGELHDADEAATLDALCVLYVAMTRAKRALYLVTAFAGRTSKAISPAALVKTRLAGEANPRGGATRPLGGRNVTVLYETGERNWHGRLPPAPVLPAPSSEWPSGFAAKPAGRKRPAHVEPSAQHESARDASSLFAPETRDVLDFGSAIHELFLRVAWVDEADAHAIVQAWRPSARASEAVRRDAVRQFERALASEDIRGALAKPPGRVELWREKAFEIVLDGRLVAGAFDRVVIERNAEGRVERAAILDYKSDRIAGEAQIRRAVERYAPQLRLYREALARILGLDADRISLRILFTRPGVVRPCPAR